MTLFGYPVIITDEVFPESQVILAAVRWVP
jgi:hypothetical protein